jgi:hypothetical protein
MRRSSSSVNLEGTTFAQLDEEKSLWVQKPDIFGIECKKLKLMLRGRHRIL